jgi:hypothetical protein
MYIISKRNNIKGKERKGKERKGKERKGKERTINCLNRIVSWVKKKKKKERRRRRNEIFAF